MGREDTVQPTDWSGVPSDSLPNATYVYNVGIYGWRKRCLYGLILFILVVVIINFALTIWILRVMDFSIDGMGKLRIVEKGIRVEGETEFLQPIHAASIISRDDLNLEGKNRVIINSRNDTGHVVSQMTLDDKSLRISTPQLIVQDSNGKKLFSADSEKVQIDAPVIRVSGESGTVFDKGVQTPSVRSDSAKHLSLESPTGSILMQAADQIVLNSLGGDVRIKCLEDLELKSSTSIHLNSKNIVLKNLKVSYPLGIGRSYSEVFQLCACSNRRLFIAPPDTRCRATTEICEIS